MSRERVLCAHCDGNAHVVTEPRKVSVGRRRAVAAVEFARCEDCAGEFYLPGQMAAAQEAAGRKIREEEGLLLPSEIRDEERGAYIGTYSGTKFYPLNPRPNDIHLLDIAHSLGKQCRYTGHTSEFYSVAEHSVLLARYALGTHNDLSLARCALMHDASEAYVSDVPRPLKPLFPNFKPVEEGIQKAVFDKYVLEWPMPDLMHEIDRRILFDEAPVLMTLPISEWTFQLEPLGVELELWSPKDAPLNFLSCAEELGII